MKFSEVMQYCTLSPVLPELIPMFDECILCGKHITVSALIYSMQKFMTVPPEISSQSELLLETTGATHTGQTPEAQVCQSASTLPAGILLSVMKCNQLRDFSCSCQSGRTIEVMQRTAHMQAAPEAPDTRDWHARRELPPMPEGQKQPARQGNDPVQRTEPLPVRREGSQQDLRPKNNQQQSAERPATSSGPSTPAPAPSSAVRHCSFTNTALAPAARPCFVWPSQ